MSLRCLKLAQSTSSIGFISQVLLALLGAGRYKATWKREFKLPWREAGPPNHHDDKVDSDQWVVSEEVSLSGASGAAGDRRELNPYPWSGSHLSHPRRLR